MKLWMMLAYMVLGVLALWVVLALLPGTPPIFDEAAAPHPAECMVPGADMDTCLDAISKAIAERDASTSTTREH